MDGKEGSEVKSMCVDSVVCGKVKSECFRIDSGVRQKCILPPWLFYVNMDAVRKEVDEVMERRGESGDCLASFMWMIWFCVESWRKT